MSAKVIKIVPILIHPSRNGDAWVNWRIAPDIVDVGAWSASDTGT
jgi:hypothetical protein